MIPKWRGEWSSFVKYTGRIAITSVVLLFVVSARIYGNMYYDVPMLKLPTMGILALLICWWLGSQYDKVKFYSEKDILTGIHNRRFVVQKFPKLLTQMSKRNRKLTMLLIDIDNFKVINDTYGHEKGDKVLQYIAKTLLSSTSKKDIVARWAGDEFLIISPCSNENTGSIIMNRVQHALRKSFEEIAIDVSVSIGASMCPRDAETLDALLHAADRKMYSMKSQSKPRTK